MSGTTYLDNWVWYVPLNRAGHARAMAESMGLPTTGRRRRVLVKAGGDGGAVWGQWGGANLAEYEAEGIEPIAWLYADADDTAISAAVETLRKRWSTELIVNCEVEWSYANGITDAGVAAWVERLRRAIRSAHGRVPEIGFSSVASWEWFPYAAWSKACDGTEQVQAYWQSWVADQAEPSRRKSRIGARVVVGLPACQAEDAGNYGESWTDAKIDALAEYYATGMRDLVGFNGWQSGATFPNGTRRSDFAYGPMRYAYSLLPEFSAPDSETVENSTIIGTLNLPYNVRAEGDVWHCVLPDGSLDIWVIQPEFIGEYLKLGASAIRQYGFPVSGMAPDETGKLVQYFERARFELGEGGHVDLGRVGFELLDTRNKAHKIEIAGHGSAT